ncbi:MAG: Ca-activated chloride channel [Actinomycetota bacterium]|jgi:Ca-activated chloride channel family protein|nr:Ca-activated chloride channel [Actinomycetota bacterium]
MSMPMPMPRRAVAVLVALAAVLTACSLPSKSAPKSADALGDPGGCEVIDVAVSSEKIALLQDLAKTFNASKDAKLTKGCEFIRPYSKASGGAATLLAEGWPDEASNGKRPEAWSPASSAWAAIVNQQLKNKGEKPIATDFKPFMLTPLTIAMPKPMADALGYPKTPIGFADILALARDPAGWGKFGHPEWGPFRLGKTNPNFSTSGLSALIAQYYAAVGKTQGLSLEDLALPNVVDFAKGVESAVVHYGDITPTFLNNLYRNDQRGASLTYVSAIAVEEKSVIDYNTGNPDGVLDPGEEPRPPRVPLVAIYPKEGTLFSDNPFIVLDAPWVTASQKEGAKRFSDYIQRPENQARVLKFGFRPGNPSVAIGAPITAANQVDATQPKTTLQVPAPDVMLEVLNRWAQQRKPAKVLLLIDVSGSMGDPAGSTGDTKLDLAKRAAIAALDQFKAEDQVGLRIFSTDISKAAPTDYVDLVPFGQISQNREAIATKIRSLVPTQGTPLYTATRDSYRLLQKEYDPARINALVLLTDGRNEDPNNGDLRGLLAELTSANEGQSSRPVRIFPIAYGADSDLATLKQMAEATNAAAYDASDPASITKVFTAVISNF